MATRIHPRVVVTRISPNRSSRAGQRIAGIVLHSTEADNVRGKGDLVGLGGWFARLAAEVSAHIATDADATSGRYVYDRDKAWACAAYNGQTLSIEQVGRAAQSHWPREQIRETARWLARWSLMYGIPLRVGKASGGRVVRRGVLTHKMLGLAGGGHVDPGAGFPLAATLRLARFYRAKLRAEHR